MDDQKLQEAKSQFFWTWTLTLLAIGFAYLFLKLRSARHRNFLNKHQTPYIDREKIIIAIEINEFLVKYSQKQEPGYLPLSIQDNDNWIVRTYKKAFKLGHYYKPLFSIVKIKEFVHGLSEIRRVELMLYSSMPPVIADAILAQLQIDRFLPKDRRKFCDLENDDDQKHAIQVDQESRRVIIITPSYEDHTYEDEKYFLVIRPNTRKLDFLKNSLRQIKGFLDVNNDLNSLHEKLGEFKLNYESDWSQPQF